VYVVQFTAVVAVVADADMGAMWTLSYDVWMWLLGTRYIKMFILDEADEMLSRGFKDQIYDVFRTLNENIQVCCI